MNKLSKKDYIVKIPLFNFLKVSDIYLKIFLIYVINN